MQLQVAIEGRLEEVIARKSKAVKKEVTGAVGDTAQWLKQRLRDQVTGAGFGSRLARTWRADTYPRRGVYSYRAAALVRSKAPKIIKAFSEGELIKSRDGLFLAIPTANAPKKGVGGKRINPSNFPEHRFGRLKFIYRRGAPSLLVVEGVRITKSGRVGRRLKDGGVTKKGTLRKGVTTVVMFILVPQVRLPRRFNVQGPAAQAVDRLAANIVRRIDGIDA